jgi:F0F1-type ATP synthase gamma subunit
VGRPQGRIEESRYYYEEAYNLLQKLVQGNSDYASEMARVEASLQELGKGAPAH